jgi:hypothetical protein
MFVKPISLLSTTYDGNKKYGNDKNEIKQNGYCIIGIYGV